MNPINYHHLYYFWITAQEMNITRAAQRLRVSQSTVSSQIISLENQFGHPLFLRIKKRLELSEAGRLAFAYSNSIFETGQELMDSFSGRPVAKKKRAIRVGAVSHLSKNLQIDFIASALDEEDLKVIVIEGSLMNLCRELRDHSLDIVLSDNPARTDDFAGVFNHPLGDMPVFLVGTPKICRGVKGLAGALKVPLFLPNRSSRLRDEFDSLIESKGEIFEVKAEVEDMALMRLFALSGRGLALVPEIVVRNELQSGALKRAASIPDLREKFFAITATRKFPNPWIAQMVKSFSRSIGKRAGTG